MTPDTEQSLLKEKVPQFPGLDSKKVSALCRKTTDLASRIHHEEMKEKAWERREAVT